MKRIRRLSLTVRHREISISVTQTTHANNGSAPNEPMPVDQAEAQILPPTHCPDCGAPWSADFAGILKDFGIPLEQLRSALLDRRLHSFWLTDGQFLVCEQSLRTLTQKPLIEKVP